GNGIKASIDGKRIIAGNRKLMKAENINIQENVETYAVKREKKGNSAIFIALDGEIAGIISIADQISDDAKMALKQMRKKGIKKMVMLTGDNWHTAEAVSAELGLDEFHAELLPENKVEFVNQLKKSGHTVAMAGDGI